jgi:hypothetical protein
MNLLLFPHPKYPTQVKVWKYVEVFPSWCTSQTENNSFERATCPCWALHCWTQRALCCRDFCLNSYWKIFQYLLCATLLPPPSLTTPSLTTPYPDSDFVYRVNLTGNVRPQVLFCTPWLSYGPHSEVCHVLTFIRKDRTQSCAEPTSTAICMSPRSIVLTNSVWH